MKKLAIGVDIGGINTAFGLVDENGDLYAESVISTKKYPYVDDYPAYVEDLCDSMRINAFTIFAYLVKPEYSNMAILGPAYIGIISMIPMIIVAVIICVKTKRN